MKFKIVLLIFSVLFCLNASIAIEKPNIIVILTDDSGYSDFSCYGNKDYHTPNVDRIAEQGILFTNGYVSGSVCSPTRAGLLTGRYQQRFGHEFNLPEKPLKGDVADLLGLPLEEETLADALKKEGYYTGIIGKWHLGYDPKFHPNNRGFDYFFGMLKGSTSYWDEKRSPNKSSQIQRNGEFVGELPYLTDAFGEDACKFIKDNNHKPFFLFVSFNAVHGPLMAKQEDYDKLGHIKSERRRVYAAMHLALDEQVGNILDQLKRLGIEKNTLLFFINDNGGPLNMGAINKGLRGQKGTVMEGGVRIPFLIQWPGIIPQGKVYDNPVISLDIFKTAVTAAGSMKKRELDGVDLIPYLIGKKSEVPHETLYWRENRCAAIRKGDWKLVRLNDRMPMLFNLKKDRGERKDIALQNIERTKELIKELFDWEVGLSNPLWNADPRFYQKNTADHDLFEVKEFPKKPVLVK